MSKQNSNDLLAKVRNKLKNLQEDNKRTTGTWKPKGDHVVRLLPYKFADWPFIELHFHYELPGVKEHLLSPVSFSDPDPIVEYSDKIKAEGTREAYLISRKLLPTMRTYIPVIVRGEEEMGVRYWGFGKQTYEEILKYMDDPEYGNIIDPHTGTDLKVSFVSAEEAGNKYGKINVSAKRNSSKLAESEELIEKYLNNQKPITDVFKVKTYEELLEILRKITTELETSEDEVVDEDGDKKEPDTSTPKKVKSEDKENVKKASEAFDKLFKEKK